MRVDGEFKHAVSERFRAERPRLEPLLNSAQDPPPELRAAVHAVDRRSATIAPATAELRRLAAAGQLTTSITDLAMSYAHMHVNRLLRSAQRAQELVLYELLARLYSSRAGRGAT
jgi:thiopeptide-type bacteriocin biosynthesis protein